MACLLAIAVLTAPSPTYLIYMLARSVERPRRNVEDRAYGKEWGGDTHTCPGIGTGIGFKSDVGANTVNPNPGIIFSSSCFC